MSASEAEYQPRYFEAQKLLAAAKRKAQTAEDKAAFAILESMLSLRSLAIGYDRAHDIEGLKKAATAQFQCTYEAHSYFDQTPFPERFRKANDEALQRRTCVAGYNQIVKEIENK